MAKFSEKRLDKMKRRQHGRCYYCGVSLDFVTFEIDHFLPFSKYRNGTSANFVLACFSCNRSKSDLEISQFKLLIQKLKPEKLIRGQFYFEFLNLHNG